MKTTVPCRDTLHLRCSGEGWIAGFQFFYAPSIQPFFGETTPGVPAQVQPVWRLRSYSTIKLRGLLWARRFPLNFVYGKRKFTAR